MLSRLVRDSNCPTPASKKLNAGDIAHILKQQAAKASRANKAQAEILSLANTPPRARPREASGQAFRHAPCNPIAWCSGLVETHIAKALALELLLVWQRQDTLLVDLLRDLLQFEGLVLAQHSCCVEGLPTLSHEPRRSTHGDDLGTLG